MTGFDLSTISDCYIGSTQASEIYYSDTKIWPVFDYSQEYLTIEPLEDGTLTFTKKATSGDLYYSNDKQNWIIYSSSINLTNGKNVYLKGDMTPNMLGNPSVLGIGNLSVTSYINVSGNIMSLLDGDNFIGRTSLAEKQNAFSGLFANNPIIKAKNIVLPATILESECYYEMFAGCTSLTIPPKLPATTLKPLCYARMFHSCTSLTILPKLPATILKLGCYQQMFANCRSLITAPELPATTLDNGCYSGMFKGCTSLITAPELPATTLSHDCYDDMFNGCTSLTTAPSLPAKTLSNYCYSGMFIGCTSLTTAPSLPAKTLSNYCYGNMFNGCSSLNEIHCYATDISATDCLSDWLNNVSPTGDFYKPSATTYPSGASGIPSGWTVHNV